MECREVLKVLNRLADESYACDWDNVGLLAGRMDKEIWRVTVALDADDRAVEEAVANDSDLLLTHHPLLFAPIKKITNESLAGRRLLRLLNHDICLVAMHTNFDIAPGGMGDLAADRLGLRSRSPLEVTGQGAEGPYGIGVVGQWGEGGISLEQLCARVKEAFDLEGVTVYGPNGGPAAGAGGSTCRISRIAVCPGSGKDEIGRALQAGAQVLITGDITYHYAIDAAAEGLVIIDAGHYGLEHIFIPFMTSYLKKQLPALSVSAVPVDNPCRYF